MHRNAHLSTSAHSAPGAVVGTEQMLVDMTELDSMPLAVPLIQSMHSKDGYMEAVVSQNFLYAFPYLYIKQQLLNRAIQPPAHMHALESDTAFFYGHLHTDIYCHHHQIAMK